MKIPKTESKTVEFKSTFNQDVLVSLVAFANADGGDVYVGVRDDGNVVGVQLAAESETTWINEIKSKTAFQTGRFKTRSHIIDDRTFNADLLGELDGVMAFVKNHLMAELVITGKPEHDVRYDYPMEAIREIVLNMLVHRDYCGAGVNTIKIFDDHMEFTNPGGLPHGLTVSDLLSDAYVTSPRNPQLASLFKAVGLTERYGSGIKRIVDACRRHGGVRVEFENHETWFKVILSKVNCEKSTGESSQKKLGEKLGEKLGGKLGENRRRIIRMMGQDPSVTTFDLAAGIGISQTAIENNITWLRLHGYIRRVGPDKGGHWEVVEN